MTFLKIITLINWVFTGVWTIGILYVIFAPGGQTDAAGQGQLTALILLGLIALGLLVWLNWMPHTWTKIVAFIIGTLFMLLVWNIVKDGFK
jgi:hypothetical protein